MKKTVNFLYNRKQRRNFAVLCILVLLLGVFNTGFSVETIHASQLENETFTQIEETTSATEEAVTVEETVPAAKEEAAAEQTAAVTEETTAAKEAATAFTEEEQQWLSEANDALRELLAEREVMALVYLAENYAVRTGADKDSAALISVPSGQTVFIQDVILNENYEAWVKVNFTYGQTDYTGYVERNNLACADEIFLEWESYYGMNPGAMSVYAAETYNYSDVDQFPESYRAALTALKKQHPNWMFVKMNTGLDWGTVIANELTGGKSLVYKSFADCTKEGAYDGGTWFYASEDVLEYYMDPRNALTENAIFQFEQLTYNSTYHTQSAVDLFLNNTFMNNRKNAPGTNKTFANIFWSVGANQNVSPFHLAARVYQEQGSGTSGLISGKYPGYEGYYNYFNVGATGTSDTQVIVNGLKYARQNNWSNAERSISGGAEVISKNYIKRGQDTLYLQKYNVNPNGYYALYTHQYMQNISAPTSEALSMKKLYQQANSLDNTFVFKIPVFENMPGAACPMPTSSTNVVLQVPGGYDNSVIYVDGIPYNAAVRNGRSIAAAANGNAKTAVVYKYNSSGVPVGMYAWTLEYKNGAYRGTAQPALENLLTYHGFSVRISGKTGIRFKTGISTELRNKLIHSNVNGFTVKEYGTLVMNNANINLYPLVKDGEKVLGGISYGMKADGTFENKTFEIVDGRNRFTSVLVGLPVEQYKTEFAFRGYIVLEKNGVQYTFYGPAVARSIYSLAKQILDMGTYKPGTNAYEFLSNLVKDADNY